MFRNVKRKIRLKPQKTIYIFYWFLLAYVISALVFWYLELDKQNLELTTYKLNSLAEAGEVSPMQLKQLQKEKQRKTAQYAGEGITFLLLIIAGAILVFRLIRKQFSLSQQQQNFMMAVTHELKTPIAVTKLNLETLLRRSLDDEKRKFLMNNTLQEANRLNALCNNMLMISQLDAGGIQIEPEVFDVNALIEQALQEYRSRFPARIFSVDLCDEAMFCGDKFLLQLAVNNLIENAVKYSGREDTISLITGETDENLYLRVADTGPGISNEEKKKVFEKHFRGAQRQTKGTGLGLYLTRRIVQYHGAKILVEDNEPRGTVFTIYFERYGK